MGLAAIAPLCLFRLLMLPTLRPRLPCVGLALAAVLGIAVADHWPLDASILFGATVACAVAAIVWRKALVLGVFVAVAMAMLHTVRHQGNAAAALEPFVENGPRVARVEGVVSSDPEPLGFFSMRQTGTFRLCISRIEIGGRPLALNTTLLATWAGPLPRYGDRVSMDGSLKPLDERTNPGQFDFAAHLRRNGVFAQIESTIPAACNMLGHGAGNPFVARSIEARRWMQNQLTLGLEESPEIAALIASMVLGMRGETPEEMKDLFRITGTLHLFAVSGLNVAMLAVMVSTALRLAGVGRRVLPLLVIPVLIFYALVTGLSASCVRATIMGVVLLFGAVIERRAPLFNSLAAAAFIILVWDTNQLFIPGFQFSFVLVFVIVALADKIAGRLEPMGAPDPFIPRAIWNGQERTRAVVARALATTAGVTLAAWIGSLAFTAGYFHLFSLSAIAANMIAVPLAFVILLLGVATTLFALVWKPLALLFNGLNALVAKLLLLVVKLFAAIPGGHVYVELPHTERPPLCELTVLDVGDGAAIHLRSGDANWLIDGGASWRYNNTTLPYLRSRGVNRLDALVLTHGDSDHIAAALPLLDDFQPRTIFDSTLKDRSSTRRQFHQTLVDRHRGKAFLQRGDSLRVGSAEMRVLYPPPGFRRTNADDQALVLLVECNGARVLLMSDAGLVTERWLLQNEPDLAAGVLVKSHHAKDFSGTPDFLARVNPQAVVVGTLDPGRPRTTLDAWVADLRSKGLAVFYQRDCGAAVLRIRDRSVEVNGFVGDQRFTSRAQ
jgi:competence protein ComEC